MERELEKLLCKRWGRRVKDWLDHVENAGENRRELRFMSRKAGLAWAAVGRQV